MVLWDGWLRGQSLKTIGDNVWQAVIVTYCLLAPGVASTG